MPYPYTNLTTGKSNNSAMENDHPDHHNKMAQALNDLKAELGSNPSGAYGTLTDRLADLEAGADPDVGLYITAPSNGTHTVVTADPETGRLPDVWIEPSTSEYNGLDQDRAHVIAPNPKDFLGRGFMLKQLPATITAQTRLGASFGYYIDPTPAALGDLAAWFFSNPPYEHAASPFDVEFTINGTPYTVAIDQDWVSATEMGQYIIQDLATQSNGAITLQQAYCSLITDGSEGDFGDLPPTTLIAALVTVTTGPTASIEVTDVGPGDPINLSLLSVSIPGFSDPIRWGVDLTGRMAGHQYTHTWSDGPIVSDDNTAAAYQSVQLYAIEDESGNAYWGTRSFAVRSEEVGFVPNETSVLSTETNVNAALDALDQAVFAATPALVSLSANGNVPSNVNRVRVDATSADIDVTLEDDNPHLVVVHVWDGANDAIVKTSNAVTVATVASGDKALFMNDGGNSWTQVF